jgi:radical SAM protein with 4Fe4S-binding SPASM domain
MMKPRKKGIRKYTVVTTTGCNARCAYCFEKGTKPVNMTMETAEKVARYIINHRGEYEEVQIDWFGGEPLYNFKVMDRICTRLKEHNVKFFSHIVSNGYFFSDKQVKKATELWHLKHCKITLDGTEKKYNRIKAYINSETQSPFLRVMNNINMLLKAGIEVTIRLHVSNENVQEMRDLITIIADQFLKYHDHLSFQILHLFELFGPQARILSSEERATLLKEIRNLEDHLVELGLEEPKRIKHRLILYRCMVDSEDAVMIVPDGHLGLCEYHLEDSYFGHIDNDEWDEEVLRRSREFCEEIPECDTCEYYPICYRLKSCKVHDICFKEQRDNRIENIRRQMLNEFEVIKNEIRKEL